MAVRQYGQRSIRWRLGGFQLADFSGGLNLRDSPNEIAPSETPDALNWTLDTRAAAKLRNGCLNAVALPGVSGKPAFIFYSPALDQWLCARETTGTPNKLKLHTRPGDLSGSWTDRGAINSSATAFASFADFPGATPKVVGTTARPGGRNTGGDAAGNTFTWDGTTYADTFTNAGAGSAIAVWQNRAWIAGYPTSSGGGANPTRLFASKIGDCATWDPAAGGLTVDIRDKDGEQLTGLGIAGGSLIVYKKRSAYRVNDSNSGAYTTIDSASGCQGPLAVVPVRGRLYTWGADSLYEWDGVGPGVRVGDKARPAFATDAALVGGVPGLAGGQLEDGMLFAYPHSAGGNSDRLLQYDPQHGWLMKHQLASTSKDEISSFARKEADLYAAVMDGDVMFKMFSETPGSDDSVLFASNNFRTAWLEPFGGLRFRPRLLQIEGLLPFGGTGTLQLKIYTDGDLTTSTTYDLTTALRASSATDQRQMVELRPSGHWRSVAFEFSTGTAASDARIYSLNLDGLLTSLR